MILIKYILLHYSFIIIAEKYGVSGKIRGMGQRFRNKIGKFLYELSECKFCVYHHIGILLIPVLILWGGLRWEYLLYPLISVGAIFLITKQKAK